MADEWANQKMSAISEDNIKELHTTIIQTNYSKPLYNWMILF